MITSKAASEGSRTFVWFTPARRRPTEYELYTVGQQSAPGHWLDVGWPVHFDNGAPPWSDGSSAVLTKRWSEFRDPNGTWQRPYVATTNQDQQALSRLLPVLVATTSGTINPAWAKEVLGRTYAAWPFVEYGLFRALAHAVREARADTIEFATVFQAVDRMRLLQDIVLHLDLLGDEPGFSETDPRDAWMRDPQLILVRELVENLVAGTDWVETLVVTALVFEPILGRLAKVELFSHCAPAFGDGATAVVLAQSVSDAAKAAAVAQELVRLIVSDPDHGARNAAVIEGWITSWHGRCTAAAQALLGAFGDCGIDARDAEAALARVSAFQSELVTGCGLTTSRGTAA